MFHDSHEHCRAPGELPEAARLQREAVQAQCREAFLKRNNKKI